MNWKDIAMWMLTLGASPRQVRRVVKSELSGTHKLLAERVLRIWEGLPEEVQEKHFEEYARKVRAIYRDWS